MNMQLSKYLSNWLYENRKSYSAVFSSKDLRCLFPNITDSSFHTLLSRAVQKKLIKRICRNIYIFPHGYTNDGLLLFHVAAKLRANHFNYLSFENVLSDYGIISQISTNWISVMSSGRSNILKCGKFGTIEFVHTDQSPSSLVNLVVYDDKIGMWRAKPSLALRDMKRTNRSLDLIDWDVMNEYI